MLIAPPQFRDDSTPFKPALVVSLLTGTAAGLFNGIVVVYGRIQPIIATLATGAWSTAAAAAAESLPLAASTGTFHELWAAGDLFLVQVPERFRLRLHRQHVGRRTAFTEQERDAVGAVLGRLAGLDGHVETGMRHCQLVEVHLDPPGQRLGRTLGFPTANLALHRKVVPLWGVFAVRVSGADAANRLPPARQRWRVPRHNALFAIASFAAGIAGRHENCIKPRTIGA